MQRMNIAIVVAAALSGALAAGCTSDATGASQSYLECFTRADGELECEHTTPEHALGDDHVARDIDGDGVADAHECTDVDSDDDGMPDFADDDSGHHGVSSGDDDGDGISDDDDCGIGEHGAPAVVHDVGDDHGVDDPATHDVADDSGGGGGSGGGADDPAGHM